METQIQISGMTCGHCVQGVTQSLRKVPGVRLAVVALASGNEPRVTRRHWLQTAGALF